MKKLMNGYQEKHLTDRQDYGNLIGLSVLRGSNNSG